MGVSIQISMGHVGSEPLCKLEDNYFDKGAQRDGERRRVEEVNVLWCLTHFKVKLHLFLCHPLLPAAIFRFMYVTAPSCYKHVDIICKKKMIFLLFYAP